MKDTVMSVMDFTKTYGDFVAVDKISFGVERGEIFGLLGPNGAGKTSTLESLEGLRPPNGGSLRVAGVDPAREARNLRNVIGVQLQSAGLPERDAARTSSIGAAGLTAVCRGNDKSLSFRAERDC